MLLVGLGWLVIFIIVSAMIFGRLARRYERERLEDGSWDDHGPKDPTFDYSPSLWRRGDMGADWFQKQIRPARPEPDEDSPLDEDLS